MLSFGLLCAILAAIGGVFFFSLRSIEKLDDAGRSSAFGEIAILERVGKNVGLGQVEVFRHLAATNPEEKERHEQVIARLVETNTRGLTNYERAISNEAEKQLFAEALQAGKDYSDRTEQLLGLSRAQRNVEAATFALATQVPTYDQYQLSVDLLLRFEQAEGRGIAAATTERIEQTRVAGDVLIALAIVIALGTGAAVLRIVGTLRQDKKSLQTEVDEHERAEQALREGEARYRLLADHSPDSILVICDEKIVFVNPATLKLLGADRPGQLIGRSVSEILHPDEHAEVARRSREVAAGMQPPPAERRLLRLDGSMVEVESRVISFLYEGKPATQVIVRDNTERKITAEKLIAQEKQYRVLFETYPSPTWVYDAETLAFLAVNDAAVRHYGYSREEFLAMTIRDIRPPQDIPLLLASGTVTVDKPQAAGVWRHRKKSGEIILVDIYVSAIRFEGRLAQLAAVLDITERKTTERQLRETEEKYRSIFDNALEGIFQSTPEGVFISANTAFARMLGFATPEELIRERNDIKQQSYAEPAKRQEFKRLLDKDGVVNDFEFEVKRRDGSTIWLSENVRSVRDAAGNALYYEGSAQDVTERKQSEQALRASDEKFRQVAENITDVFYMTSPDMQQMHYVSPAYENIWGRSVADLYAHPQEWVDAILSEDRERVWTTFGRLAAGEPSVSAEFRIARPDGDVRWILSRGFQVRDAAGNLIRITGVATDITERRQAEQKLLEQAELLNLAQDAIMVRDMDDRIQFWNYGAEVLYGWTAEEARGQLSCEFLHYEKPLKMLAERTLLETGAWSGECRHLTKQGVPVVVRSRWTLVRDEHGKPKSKLIIATDMTEQKKIEEQFFRAQRLESIGTLASGVAHDLNNILVPIMMAAPVLRGNIDPSERERFLDIVETSAQRGADIIKQVLTFARGADGGDRTLLQPIFLLEEVCKIASQTFPKSIALRTFYKEDIRLLEADSTQLHQILLNLCINARDAMPNGGELCLGAENFDVDERYASTTPGAIAGPHVMLEVVDTGSGIPSDVIDKIFDPFFTTKSLGQGTGLGLSTVAGIVKSHGGFVDVSSQPGRTSFKIFLPAKAALDAAAALQVDAMVPRGNGQTILLVDDEPSIREVAEVILTSHGYKVLVAEDGPTALAIFARQMGHIAVVVTDLAMPGMDGLMLVTTLRRIEPGLKIIVSTGRADESHAAEITALGVDGCLTKPYTSRNLLLKLSHVLYSGMHAAA